MQTDDAKAGKRRWTVASAASFATVLVIGLSPTTAFADPIEMICNVTHVKRGYTPIDYYYIVDTAASTVADRSRNIGTYRAQVTATTVDWMEGGEAYFLDLNSGHMTFRPANETIAVDWVCRRAPKAF